MSYRRKNIEITWWGLTVRVWQQECLLTELACLHTDVCVRTCACCCGLTQYSSWSTVTWIKASPTELHTMDINRTLLLDLPFSFLTLENCLNLGYNYDACTWLTIDSFFIPMIYDQLIEVILQMECICLWEKMTLQFIVPNFVPVPLLRLFNWKSAILPVSLTPTWHLPCTWLWPCNG